MKQITSSEQISDRKYYGVVLPGGKGFIGQLGYMEGNFRIFSPELITVGNCWDSFDSIFLDEIIGKVLEMAKDDNKIFVYEFNTYKSLFRWLSVK